MTVVERQIRYAGGYKSKKGDRVFSYSLTLPQEWVERNNLSKEGSKVIIIASGNKLIVMPKSERKVVEKVIDEVSLRFLKEMGKG